MAMTVASKLTAIAPLPIRQDWAPIYLSAREGAVNRDFAFKLRDAEGMPSNDGSRYHGAVDWFAPAGTQIVAPVAGRVVESERSTDSTGPVFGGTLKIQDAAGRVWVLRHVQPSVGVGFQVIPGQVVAEVHSWLAGGTHLHLEIWRTLAGGYRIENAIDPSTVEWAGAEAPKPAAEFYFEELPWDQGGNGPVIIGNKSGFTALRAKVVAAAFRLRGHFISTVATEDGKTYVLSWAPGTHGTAFRFGPWVEEAARDTKRLAREKNTGRVLRPFKGSSRSLYPWPKTS